MQQYAKPRVPRLHILDEHAMSGVRCDRHGAVVAEDSDADVVKAETEIARVQGQTTINLAIDQSCGNDDIIRHVHELRRTTVGRMHWTPKTLTMLGQKMSQFQTTTQA